MRRTNLVRLNNYKIKQNNLKLDEQNNFVFFFNFYKLEINSIQ